MTNFSLARTAFLAAAGKCEEFAHPMSETLGGDIATDVCWLGHRDASSVLVLISGTHGIEGYAGSMVQTALLRDTLLEPPPGVAVLLIHAINPVGMATFRRVTEEDIDLNRNFVAFPRVDENIGFDSNLAELLAPHPDQLTQTGAQILKWMASQGPAARATVASGQYSFSFAPFFGGFAPAWSRRTLETIATSYLHSVKRLCVIDYHTGLGTFGIGQLIGASASTAQEKAEASQIWGPSYVPVGGQASVSFDFGGDLIGGLKAMCPDAFAVIAAHEFGTTDEMTVLAALRHDHGAVRFNQPRHLAIQEMLAAFCPDSEPWRQGLIAQAKLAVTQAFNWLAKTNT